MLVTEVAGRKTGRLRCAQRECSRESPFVRVASGEAGVVGRRAVSGSFALGGLTERSGVTYLWAMAADTPSIGVEPAARAAQRAVILAAGRGVRLGPLTAVSPKPLVLVNGKSILARQLEFLEMVGVREVLIVTGYLAETLQEAAQAVSSGIDLHFVQNHEYASTNSAHSLFLARDFIRAGGFIVEGDAVFAPQVAPFVRQAARSAPGDLIWFATPWEPAMEGCLLERQGDRVVAIRIERSAREPGPSGGQKSCGLLFVTAGAASRFVGVLDQEGPSYRTRYYDLLLGASLHQLDIRLALIETGLWAEIDTPEDLAAASELFP